MNVVFRPEIFRNFLYDFWPVHAEYGGFPAPSYMILRDPVAGIPNLSTSLFPQPR
jgi:hypothetical protein